VRVVVLRTRTTHTQLRSSQRPSYAQASRAHAVPAPAPARVAIPRRGRPNAQAHLPAAPDGAGRAVSGRGALPLRHVEACAVQGCRSAREEQRRRIARVAEMVARAHHVRAAGGPQRVRDSVGARKGVLVRAHGCTRCAGKLQTCLLCSCVLRTCSLTVRVRPCGSSEHLPGSNVKLEYGPGLIRLNSTDSRASPTSFPISNPRGLTLIAM